MIPRQPESFEEAISVLLLGIGSIERIKALESEQQARFRQAVVRLSNLERKMSREGF